MGPLLTCGQKDCLTAPYTPFVKNEILVVAEEPPRTIFTEGLTEEIVKRQAEYQSIADTLHIAMEKFSEISYDPEKGDPLIGIEALSNMLNKAGAILSNYLHNPVKFPDYIRDSYINDLIAIELVLEPFSDTLEEKIRGECSILFPLLRNTKHAKSATIQLKALQNQLSFMHEISINTHFKIKNWVGYCSSSLKTEESHFILIRLQALCKHLEDLNDKLARMSCAIGKTLKKMPSCRTIQYGTLEWKLLVKSRPKKQPKWIEKFFRIAASYLNPLEYLPEKWRPSSLQIKGTFLLTLTAGQQLHKYSQLFNQSSVMRSEADRLQKKAKESVPTELSQRLEKEKGFMSTLLVDKYEAIASTPSLIAKLTKRFPETAPFLSKIVTQCGPNKPLMKDIHQFMQDYENVRLAPFISPFAFQSPYQWYKKFTSVDTLQRKNQDFENIFALKPLEAPTQKKIKRPFLTDLALYQAIVEIPAKGASFLTIAVWEKNIANPNYPLQAHEKDLAEPLSRLSSEEKLNLLESLIRYPGQGHNLFLKLAKTMALYQIMNQADWTHLIEKLVNVAPRLGFELAGLFVDIVSEKPHLKNLRETEDFLKLTHDSSTYLYNAVQKGNSKKVKLLIKIGAYPFQFFQGNYLTMAEDLGHFRVRNFFAKRYPSLKAEADEISRIKRIAHILELNGTILLKTRIGSSSRTISLESYPHLAFFSYAAQSIQAVFKNRRDLLPANIRKAIVKSLKKSSSKAYTPAQMYADYLAGQPVIIPTGWNLHSLNVVIFKSNFMICNKGALSLRPIEAYTINPRKITVRLIEKLISLRTKEIEDFKAFFGEEDPYIFLKRINSVLLNQLNCSDESDECWNRPFDYLNLEPYVQRGLQIVGNCPWENKEVAIYVLMHLLNVPESTNTTSLRSRNENNFAFDVWEEYTQGQAYRDSLNQWEIIEKIKEQVRKFPKNYQEQFLRNYLFA